MAENENIKEEVQLPNEEVRPLKKQKKVTRSIHDILGGDYLSKDRVLKNVPFLFFLAILALIYIGNTYYAEKTYKDIERTKNELKELRFIYLTTKSSLKFNCRQTEIATRAEKLGLKEASVPPYKIFYNSVTPKNREE